MNAKLEKLEAAALAAWRPVKLGFDKLKPTAIIFGKALIELRAAMPNRGDFAKWRRRNGIDENRAQYCIRLAEGKVKKAEDILSARERFLEPLVSKLSAIYREAEKGNLARVQQMAALAKKQFEETLDRLVATARKSAAYERKAA